MSWEKLGVFYVPESNGDWRVSHAQLPIVDQLQDNILRVYFGTRNKDNKTSTDCVDVDADDPTRILRIPDEPLIGLGERGCFDDGGVLPSWVVSHGGLKFLYYIGWNAGVTVGYRNSIGVAVSDDDGLSWTRMYKGPIVDRTKYEPQFCSSPCIRIENGIWRMWYLSGVRWDIIDGRAEPIYHIKYAESLDGIEWDRRGIICIDLKSEDEGGITRPCVVFEDGIYKMWYSYRGIADYRTNSANTYRIGYAESDDGIGWERKDEEAGIDVEESGWDSEMVAFAYIYWHKGQKFMMYNGNQFGLSGIGYARWQD